MDAIDQRDIEVASPESGDDDAALIPLDHDDQAIAANSPQPVIAIVHASVGSGHRAAALAIQEAFEALRGSHGIPQNVRIDVIDILDYGRIHFDGNKTAASFTGATRPIYDITWRYTLTGRLLWGGGYSWSTVMFDDFTSYIDKNRPLAVVCTHITGANAAVGARMLTDAEFPIICVPTDYEIEGWWPHLETDLFCVGTEFMAETLRPRKVPERAIKVTGIPVRQGYLAQFDRLEKKRELGLPEDKTIVLVMAGASLPQPYVRFRDAIEKTIPYLRGLEDMHFVFLPGRDDEYRAKLERIFGAMRLDNVTVMGYVTDMAGLMHASDLAILKSGGLTVTECLCAELPMILLGKSYGQEKANTTMLTSMGASMHATTPRELIITLKHLHDHPGAIKAMLINADVLRRPLAAEDIARAAMELVGKTSHRSKRFAEFYLGDKPAHTR